MCKLRSTTASDTLCEIARRVTFEADGKNLSGWGTHTCLEQIACALCEKLCFPCTGTRDDKGVRGRANRLQCRIFQACNTHGTPQIRAYFSRHRPRPPQ